jgi:hypothetical protein
MDVNQTNCISQLPEWINIDRQSPSSIYYSPHINYFSWTITDPLASMACLVIEAEIGHVGNAGFQWRSTSLECSETTRKRATPSYSRVEEVRLDVRGSKMDGLVKERKNCAVSGRVGDGGI